MSDFEKRDPLGGKLFKKPEYLKPPPTDKKKLQSNINYEIEEIEDIVDLERESLIKVIEKLKKKARVINLTLIFRGTQGRILIKSGLIAELFFDEYSDLDALIYLIQITEEDLIRYLPLYKKKKLEEERILEHLEGMIKYRAEDLILDEYEEQSRNISGSEEEIKENEIIKENREEIKKEIEEEIKEVGDKGVVDLSTLRENNILLELDQEIESILQSLEIDIKSTKGSMDTKEDIEEEKGLDKKLSNSYSKAENNSLEMEVFESAQDLDKEQDLEKEEFEKRQQNLKEQELSKQELKRNEKRDFEFNFEDFNIVANKDLEIREEQQENRMVENRKDLLTTEAEVSEINFENNKFNEAIEKTEIQSFIEEKTSNYSEVIENNNDNDKISEDISSLNKEESNIRDLEVQNKILINESKVLKEPEDYDIEIVENKLDSNNEILSEVNIEKELQKDINYNEGESKYREEEIKDLGEVGDIGKLDKESLDKESKDIYEIVQKEEVKELSQEIKEKEEKFKEVENKLELNKLSVNQQKRREKIEMMNTADLISKVKSSVPAVEEVFLINLDTEEVEEFSSEVNELVISSLLAFYRDLQLFYTLISEEGQNVIIELPNNYIILQLISSSKLLYSKVSKKANPSLIANMIYKILKK